MSGQPLNLRYPDASGILSDGQPDFLGNVAPQPNYVGGDLLLKTGVERHLGYFNRAAVPVPFGTWGRNVVYGFPLRQTNLAPAKSFQLPVINEGSRLTFRGEFDNPFHQTNFAGTDVNLANAAFGRVGSMLDPRLVQLPLTLSF